MIIQIKRNLALCALVLAGTTWTCRVSAQDEAREHWEHSTWRMAVSLDAKHLVPPAVQWTDPIEVQTGKEIQITLSEKNMFDLESALDQAMTESTKDQ